MRSRLNPAWGLFALVIALVVVTGASVNVFADDEFRLGTKVEPTFQSIELKLDADKPDYTGAVTVDLSVKEPVNSFRVHAREMSLTEITLKGDAGSHTLTSATAQAGLVTLSSSRTIAPGSYKLHITFSNDFDTQATSLYRLETGGHGYTFTQFEATDAQGAFPCWDEPSFKIPYQMTLVVPEGHVAVSNTPVEKEAVSSGWKTVTFERTRPLPSYLLAIATGPLELVPIKGMPIPGNVVTVQGQSHLVAEALKATPPILAALEKYFGRPYPYKKLDLIAVPEFWPGAMENAGAVTFADRILLVDPKAASVVQKQRIAAVIAHEFAHMWFGDLVTMEWWDDLWLNESFASWMGDKVMQEVYPEYNTAVNSVRSADFAMLTDARATTRAIRQPVKSLDNLLQSADVLAYSKGKIVLGMFEAWIDEDEFRKGIHQYLKKHEWSNATGDDLWNAVSQSSGKDMSGPMGSFLNQPGVPVITVEPLTGGKVRVTQKRFRNFGAEESGDQLWQVPVRLKYPDGDSVMQRNILLTGASQVIDLDTGKNPAWVHPNAGETGYYRWNVPPDVLVAMAGDAERHLSPKERIGFLGNVSALMMAGEIPGEVYMSALARFSGDSHPDVIRALATGIARVRDTFISEEFKQPFAEYVRKTLGPAMDRFGIQRTEGEAQTVSRMRPTLLGLLADEGEDLEARNQAKEIARKYMLDPASVDPSLAGVSLGLAALDGDAALFEEYRRRFESTKIPAERTRFLGALASFRDPALIDKALAYALEGPLRPQEMTRIPQTLRGDKANRDLVYDWFTRHFDTIVSRIPPMAAVFTPYFAAGCSESRLAKAEKFFTTHGSKIPGIQKEIAKMAETVRDCAALKEREGDSVARYLNGLSAGSGGESSGQQ